MGSFQSPDTAEIARCSERSRANDSTLGCQSGLLRGMD